MGKPRLRRVARPDPGPLRTRRLLGFAIVGVGGVVATELSAWRASVSWNRPLDRDAPCAVVVLGYPSRTGGKLHPLQKWRTEIGLRTLGQAGDGFLILSGAATREGSPAEAEVMATYAIDELGVPADQVRLETEATNTWQNLERSLPLAADASQIAIASDPFHASRARRYAARQRPDLADRLVASADYRFLDRWWLKLPVGAYESVVRVRDLARIQP